MKADEGSLWLSWAREIQAIGQTGLYFSGNEFDRQRYQKLIWLASEIFSKYSHIPPELYREVFLCETGYATPKVDVRAVVFREGEVLMVRERSDGGWSLPGGWADVNEAPSSMVEREVFEESGLTVKAVKVTGVYEANHDRDPVDVFHAYKVVFLCDLLKGEMRGSYETTDVSFFAIDNLPDLSVFRTQPRYIEEAYAHVLDPNRPAAFD
jgi:ADP-ribose pyrophosphatase YjhB (NUDIX family)